MLFNFSEKFLYAYSYDNFRFTYNTREIDVEVMELFSLSDFQNFLKIALHFSVNNV